MKNDRVLILTWCATSLNFGETLQAYAMQSIVKKFHMRPCIVSYLDNTLRKNKSIYHKSILGYLKFFRFIKKHMCKVIQYGEEKKVEKFSKEFDIFICGSDQVWNPCYYEKHKVFYLNFGDKNKKRISYAPSMGVSKIEKKNERIIKEIEKSIKNFDYVSVREYTAWEILNKNQNIHVVLDPTLIISRKEWSRLAARRKKKEDYILVYILGSISHYRKMIFEAQKKYEAKNILWIDVIRGESLEGDIVKKLKNLSPEDFLFYIENAKAVITDSFHGVMFSIKFRRNFFALDRKYHIKQTISDPRVPDILKRLHLEQRKVCNIKDLKEAQKKIDYSQVETYYQKEREKSILFWKEALLDEKNKTFR